MVIGVRWMPDIICLVVDRFGVVTTARIIRTDAIEQAVHIAAFLARQQGSVGFELWRDQMRIARGASSRHPSRVRITVTPDPAATVG
jgi:hypothetical protein